MLMTHPFPTPLLALSPPPWGIRPPNSWATSLNPPSTLILKQLCSTAHSSWVEYSSTLVLVVHRPLDSRRTHWLSSHTVRQHLHLLIASCSPPPAGCSIASCYATSTSCCATISHLLAARLLPPPLIGAAASRCLCLPLSAGASHCLCLPSSASTSSWHLHLLSASRCQPAPLILSRQADCHVAAAGTPPHQMPSPLQPLLPPLPLPPLSRQPLLLPLPLLPAPSPPLLHI
jgi:hypothetical protein